ncbi:MAG: efflux RND transporter permease subunit, partial [Myxococcota bacterium]|nr:efflux RND transporter permease subunit [Myxococcota bacterium]
KQAAGESQSGSGKPGGKQAAKGKKGKKGKKGTRRGKKRKKDGVGGGRGGRGGSRKSQHRAMTAFLDFELPDDARFLLVSDQARFIERAVDDVIGTGLWGALLAVLVLFLFLRHGASTAIIATAIPISVVVTFAPMYLFDVSLNLMSLGGLALSIGMLVDNSIVVLESVHRCREEGDDDLTAAVRGTREVASAVVASTLTTVAVFLPIVFVTGVSGQLFGHLALTVVFGLLASLAVALFVIPVLVAVRLRRESAEGLEARGTFELRLGQPFKELREGLRWLTAEPGWRRPLRFAVLPLLLFRFVVMVLCLWPLWIALKALRGAVLGFQLLVRGVGLGLGRPAGWTSGQIGGSVVALRVHYRRLLGSALRSPWLVLIPAVLLFVASLQVMRTLGQELLPEVHQSVVLADLRLPVGTPLERTVELADALSTRTEKLAAVDSVFVAAGVKRDIGAGADSGENTADLVIRLHPSKDPAVSEAAVREEIRAIAGTLPGLETTFSSPALFSFRTPLEIEVRGEDLDELRRAADAVVAALAPLDGLRDVRSNLGPGYPEVQIRYDRDKLARYGLDIGIAATAVRDKVAGRVATDLRGQGRRTEVRVILRDLDRQGLDDLARLNVNPRGNPPIALEAVATLVAAEGPSEIRRSEGRRSALVTANLSGLDLGTSGAQVESVLDSLPPIGNIELEVSGQSREMKSSLRSLGFALMLAIFLVYIIMASLFESVRQPFVILLAVPMALVGVVVALWAGAVPVSVVVLIGAIVLAGVVVNNAIVLVDYTNRLRGRGLPLVEALIEASSVRLRPILISTLTTVLGLLPMAMAGGEGSEIRQPLALTVIAGLASATVLTLVVLPVLYQLLEGRRREV